MRSYSNVGCVGCDHQFRLPDEGLMAASRTCPKCGQDHWFEMTEDGWRAEPFNEVPV